MDISDDLRQVLQNLTPVDVPEVPCAECGPSIDGRQVTHEAMCPVAICIEDATQGDRQWFEAHPFSDHYHRPVTWAEGLQLLLADEKLRLLAQAHRLTAMGKVRVERGADDLRFRTFGGVYFVVQ